MPILSEYLMVEKTSQPIRFEDQNKLLRIYSLFKKKGIVHSPTSIANEMLEYVVIFTIVVQTFCWNPVTLIGICPFWNFTLHCSSHYLHTLIGGKHQFCRMSLKLHSIKCFTSPLHHSLKLPINVGYYVC